jgi:hypothetical protein
MDLSGGVVRAYGIMPRMKNLGHAVNWFSTKIYLYLLSGSVAGRINERIIPIRNKKLVKGEEKWQLK